MYVVTNRNVLEDRSGLEQFSKKPNALGPNELRLAEVKRQGRGWRVDFLDDRLTQTEVRDLKRRFRLPIDETRPHYASLRVACEIAERARRHKRHVLFYVHGFNNDMNDVIAQAADFEKRYGNEVLAFSWPADGGGVGGVFNYKGDKRDARASTGALERVLNIIHGYFAMITEARRRELYDKASVKHPDAAESRNMLYAKLLEKDCPFTVNAMFHSMGNYLLKQMLKSSVSEGDKLIFDNVILCQADTNHLDHDLWVGRVPFRKRLYVTINEDDFALQASRVKVGSDQLARLGHYARNLSCADAHYVNFTNAAWVRNSHSPFGEPAQRNEDVYRFFSRAFSGQAAEDDLRYRPEGNWYEFR